MKREQVGTCRISQITRMVTVVFVCFVHAHEFQHVRNVSPFSGQELMGAEKESGGVRRLPVAKPLARSTDQGSPGASKSEPFAIEGLL